MSKKILYVFRGEFIARIFKLPEARRANDFLFGYNYLNKKYDCDYFVASREKKITFLEKIFFLLEKPFNLLTKLGFPLDIYPLFRKKVKKADLIFCKNETIGFGILFYKMLGLIKAKVVVVVMSLPERLKYFKKNMRLIFFISKLLAKADFIFTLSQHAQKPLRDKFFVPKQKLQFLPCGTDINFWKPKLKQKKQKYILSVGNDMNRDFSTLIKAVPKDLKLILVTAKKVSLMDKTNIKIISGISDLQLRNLYKRAFLTVIPSIGLEYESSGLSCTLQAMACGSPVLVSSSPPLKELFKDKIHCLFYKPQSVSDLKKKLLKLQTSSRLRHYLIVNALKKIRQKHTTLKMAGIIARQINKMLV